MSRAALATVAAVVLAPAAFASHPSWSVDARLNVDADRALERVVAEYEVSSDHSLERAEIAVVDKCAGRVRRYGLAPPGRSMDREGILGLRELGRPAVLFSIVYPDRREIARVVQLRAKRRGACPRPAAIFDYSSARPPYPAPEGLSIRDAMLAPGEHSTVYAGRELLLTEEYAGPRGNPIRMLRRTYYRYAPAKRRYVAYHTEVSPPA
jgi:hypothetical protein